MDAFAQELFVEPFMWHGKLATFGLHAANMKFITQNKE
jgi:hypothetical protein